MIRHNVKPRSPSEAPATVVRTYYQWLRRPALRLIGIVVLVVAGMVAAVVAVEVLLRIVPGLMPPDAANRARVFSDLSAVRTRPDPYIGFLYPRNFEGSMRHLDAVFTFRTDSRGFRNSEPWPERTDLIALGDSVTFGFGVPDGHSWVALAARTLGYTTVNLALPGMGPLQQLRVYERFGAALRPKIVLLGFFPANDFWDTRKFLQWLGLPDRGNYILWRDFGVNNAGPESVVSKMLKSSYVGSLLWAITNQDGYGRDGVARQTEDGPLVLSPRALRKLRSTTAPDRPEFVEVFEALRRLKDLVHASGGRLVVVVLPSKESVYPPVIGMGASDPLEHVYRALSEYELSYLAVTPHLRARGAAGERLFFELDGHPNGRGYAVIAGAVAEYLRPGSSGADAEPAR